MERLLVKETLGKMLVKLVYWVFTTIEVVAIASRALRKHPTMTRRPRIKETSTVTSGFTTSRFRNRIHVIHALPFSQNRNRSIYKACP